MRNTVSGYFFVTKQRIRSKNKVINILYQNVRGLRTKTSQLVTLLESSGSNLFAFTETGCNESIQDAEITPPGFSILRCDRADGRKQGGVLLAAAPRYELRQVQVTSDININKHNFELISASIYKQNRLLFTCCVVYIPPNSEENEYIVMFSLLEDICIKYKHNVVILGDFNLFSCNSSICNCYDDFTAFCELDQCNNVPNCNGRQLDLVLSGRNDVSVAAGDEALWPVDAYHPSLAVSVVVATSAHSDLSHLTGQGETDARMNQWNFNKADFNQVYNLIMNIDWTDIYTISDSNLAVNVFYDNIYEVFDKCVPKKTQKLRNPKYIYPSWYTSQIIKDIQIKYNLHKKYKASKSRSDYAAFSQARARVKADTANARGRHRDRVQNHLVSDPKAFWNYIRSKRRNLRQNKLFKNGCIITDQECANEFAQYFYSVYNPKPAQLDVAAAGAAAGGNCGARVHLAGLCLAEVRRALTCLPAKHSVGPDGIPPFIFRDCRFALEEPLLHIYNVCLANTTFPDRWKVSRVVPIPKAGGGLEPGDYRPVALLCTPAKVFESAIHHSMYAQVRAQLSDAQHGFRPGRGTTGNLLNLMTRVVPAVDAGRQVDVVYFDFRKAFDTVDNDILLRKLAYVGCTPHTLTFFANYLRDRRQYVDCAGCLSEQYFTRSGVSQGSNLGPLQFILMINDLPDVVQETTCLLFADDLKLVHEIDDVTDHARLQSDIDRVVEWSHNNNMHFNISKCSVLTFSRARAPCHHPYHLEGVPFRRVTEVKDLGVRFTAELNFRDHIAEVCKKAYQTLGFVLRQSDGFTNINAIRALYEALVKSHLEFNSAIWAPNELKYKRMLERIQNKFTRHLYRRLYGVYPGYPLLYPTLFVLGMTGYSKLETRRDVFLVNYLFKVLRGKMDNPRILEWLQLSAPNKSVSRRRRPQLLTLQHARTNLLRETPLTRALRTLNTVAVEIDVFSCSPIEFTRVVTQLLSYN